MKALLLPILFFVNIIVTYSQINLTKPFPRLPSFDKPVEMRFVNDGTDRVFVVEQYGKIFVFNNSFEATKPTLFLDLSDVVGSENSETGLLGLAFHPDFKNNGTFYVNYNTDKNGPRRSVIASFKISKEPNVALKTSEKQLLVVEDPAWNHNGGGIQFGPDGYLYFTWGDGGSGNDPWNNGQNLSSYWGKMHRINIADTSNGKKYGIPNDNPFYKNTQGFKQEIFAYGLRNVWRFNFDLADNNKIWAGDVGQNTLEEISIIEKGKNYGWKITEGHICRPGGGKNCNENGLKSPVWSYGRADGTSVTGGYVYRGNSIPALNGKYVYADYTFGRMWALSINSKDTVNQLLKDLDVKNSLMLSSFAEDLDKELYVLGHNTGKIYKLTPDKNYTSENTFSVSKSSSNTQISLELNTNYNSDLKVNIMDKAGNDSEIIFEGKKTAGVKKYDFNTSKLPKGNSFIKIKAGPLETMKQITKR